MLTEGQTISWFTAMESGTSQSSTSVISSSATMFGIPVNGFNIITSTEAATTNVATAETSDVVGSTSTSASASVFASPSSASTEASSTSSIGLTIGVALGVSLAVLLLGLGAFIFWKRRRRQIKLVQRTMTSHQSETLPEYTENASAHKALPGYEWSSTSTTAPTTGHSPTELPLTNPTQVFELPERQIHELPERWDG